jgi:RNA polymerase sigma-70 factor (ECF subfamily)
LRRTSPAKQERGRSDAPDLSAHVPALRRYIAKRASPSDVDDLVQDVLVRMHVRGQADPIANVEGYLFQVAASVLTDRARRDIVRHRGAHHELTEALHPVDELTPERVLRGREDVDRLAAALEEMPILTRDAFVLHRFEEMSYDAIGEHLGISTSAVGRHIMKAIRFLAARDLP